MRFSNADEGVQWYNGWIQVSPTDPPSEEVDPKFKWDPVYKWYTEEGKPLYWYIVGTKDTPSLVIESAPTALAWFNQYYEFYKQVHGEDRAEKVLDLGEVVEKPIPNLPASTPEAEKWKPVVASPNFKVSDQRKAMRKFNADLKREPTSIKDLAYLGYDDWFLFFEYNGKQYYMLTELWSEWGDLIPDYDQLLQEDKLDELSSKQEEAFKSGALKELAVKRIQQAGGPEKAIQSGVLEGPVDEEFQVQAAKVDPTKFTSILESAVQQIQADPKMTLEQARQIVEDKVEASGINEQAKQEIKRNLRDPRITHVMPVSMRDQSSLVTYLFNSILKYKGLGVVKSTLEPESYPDSTPPSSQFVDPNEKEDVGYGGDRPGVWVSPNATLRHNIGSLLKGEQVVITGKHADKVLFYVEKDPSLVGIIKEEELHLSPIQTISRDERLRNFVKCHAYIATSPKLLSKIAEELTLPEDLLQELKDIQEHIQVNRENLINSLPISPSVNPEAQLRDAAEFFILANKIPTQKDTLEYLTASLSSAYGLDLKAEDISSLVASEASPTAEWMDMLLALQRRYNEGKLAAEDWKQIVQTMNEGSLEDLRVLVNKLYHEEAPVEKTSAPPPPPPPNVPQGKKYMWDASTQQYVLVDASKKKSLTLPFLNT